MDKIKSLTNGSSYFVADYEVIDYGIKIVDDNNIRLVGPCGFVGHSNYQNTKQVKATEKGDYIYIYEKIAFAAYVSDHSDTVNYFKDHSRNGAVIETLTSSQVSDSQGNALPNSEPNWALYNTYKYSIKKLTTITILKNLNLLKNKNFN